MNKYKQTSGVHSHMRFSSSCLNGFEHPEMLGSVLVSLEQNTRKKVARQHFVRGIAAKQTPRGYFFLRCWREGRGTNSVFCRLAIWDKRRRGPRRVVRVGCGYGCLRANGSAWVSVPQHVINIQGFKDKPYNDLEEPCRLEFPETIVIMTILSTKCMFPMFGQCRFLTIALQI